MGILGLGRIGQRTAQLANVFGMNVLAYDPFQPKAFSPLQTEGNDLANTFSVILSALPLL